MDWFDQRVAKTQSLVCIDPSHKSSTACFVKISSPNFLIIVYEVVLDNFMAGINK